MFLFSLEEFPVDDNCAIEKDIKMGHYNEIDKNLASAVMKLIENGQL